MALAVNPYLINITNEAQAVTLQQHKLLHCHWNLQVFKLVMPKTQDTHHKYLSSQ